MPTIGVKLIGRFGNKLFQYAFGRAYAEAMGCTLETDPWIGQRLFGLSDPSISAERTVVGEEIVQTMAVDVNIECYAQSQQCADLYSRDMVRKWFTFVPEIADKLPKEIPEVAIHLRRGDYWDAGYPIVGIESYLIAMRQFGYQAKNVTICSEENPSLSSLPQDIDYLSDFALLMNAKVHFRSNSSFSWWAATLGHGLVFSPVIDGLVSGVSHNRVPFVSGNHPRLADIGFITDIHLK